MGSLNSIEKYEIEFDKWTEINIKLKTALHDLTSVYLGEGKVMILGGNNENGISKEIEIKDLSTETNKLNLKIGGKCYYSPMLDDQGKLHLFFGYGDSQLVHESLEIKEYLREPIITQTKTLVTEDIPIESPQNKTPKHQQMPIDMNQSRSQPKMRVQNERFDFQKYNPIRDSSPILSSDFNISPNVYPDRKNKIRNLKAGIHSNKMNTDMQYENYFYLRNASKNSSKKLPFMNNMKTDIETQKNTFSKTNPELNHNFNSGINSTYTSARHGDEFQYKPPKHRFNY
jgi:hypothetical protein